jgi:dihydrofolate synthase / folylpolyglutamate synthase
MANIPSWPAIPLWKIPKKQTLDNSLKILSELGNPQENLPLTIHIAGTNGKGSTLAMLKSIFNQAGYSTHSYTSPHLVEFNERIELCGKAISDSYLKEVLQQAKNASDRLKITPTFFEGITIAAFIAFSQTPADILLLETGLGGRIDCTNVINSPAITIITTISYDHMEYLGNTLEKIATEKAGIIKQNVPCIIGLQTPEIYNLLIDKCNQMQSSSFCYEYDFISEKTNNGFKYRSKNIEIELPMPSLKGDHQILNASMAIAAITLLNNKFKINNEQIKQGLKNTKWSGRLQHIHQDRIKNIVGANIEIYIDGAHNESGAAALSQWIKNNISTPVYMILGMTKNRDISKFCSYFQNIVSHGVAVNVESEPSSYSASIIAQKANNSGISFVEADSLIEALLYVRSRSNGHEATIIITGSLFLMSDFFKLDQLKHLENI